jgi:signal transduction histidine kinase
MPRLGLAEGTLRSIRNRLTLLFGLVTLGSIAAVYLYLVPQLESGLREEKVAQMKAAASARSGSIGRTVDSNVPAPGVLQRVRQAADTSAARVTLLQVSRVGGDLQLHVEADSGAAGKQHWPDFDTAERAARSGAIVTGTENSDLGRLAEAAQPLRDHSGEIAAVVVYSTPLSDVQRNVGVVRRKILVAGALALLFALLAGYLVARRLSRRIKRLERAARRVAAGDFPPPIPIDSADELGQLALAFNAMQSQLAQLDNARKQFIATASHELRTPIFSLGGFLELLEDEDLDEETRNRFLEQLRLQVERLRKLSVDLLDLSRLEAGSLDLRPEPVDLSDLARQVTAEFEPALARHDSNLELRLPRRHVEALCDPVRVAQIMRILIDNALTHTPPGTNLVVTAGRENGAMRLAVRDRGGGIDRQALAQIFEPFYTSNDAQGSGLGLAIASELAERMNGRLDVESRPGLTTFTLEIPA